MKKGSYDSSSMTTSKNLNSSRSGVCSYLDCGRPIKAKLMCTTHYSRMRKGVDMGKPFPAQRERAYPLLGNWYLNSEGYVARGITVAYGVQKVQLQHRVVMEELLGRPLRTKEEVHHINGVRSDNRPENLELWVKSQPAGQRPEDLVAWAEEILELYGPSVKGLAGGKAT